MSLYIKWFRGGHMAFDCVYILYLSNENALNVTNIRMIIYIGFNIHIYHRYLVLILVQNGANAQSSEVISNVFHNNLHEYIA